MIEILFQMKFGEVCLQKIEQFETIYISMLTLHLVFYFGKKAEIAFDDIKFFVDQFNILDFSFQNYITAQKIVKNSDFEDALQIACCLDNQINSFYTLDKSLIKNYKSKVAFV
jgi:predicted nucleic acid-binding protein